MLGTGSFSKPGPQAAIDVLLVGLRVAAPEVLAHQLNPDLEEFERQPE